MLPSQLKGWVAVVVGLILTTCCSLRADTDFNHNGMSDVWELKYNASGLSTNADNDGDRRNNLAESVARIDPFSSSSVLAFATVSQSGGIATVSWASLTGKRYQVQSCTNLAQGVWINEGGLLAGNASQLTAIIPAASSAKFFRVIVTDVDSDGDGAPDWDELQVDRKSGV